MNNLLETYVVAAEIIRNWFVEKMIDSLNTDKVPEDFKEHMRKTSIDNDKLSTILNSNPRTLFDIFDSYGLYINIYAIPLEDVSVEFSYKILPRDAKITALTRYSNRINAEKVAVADAFELLNNKL